MSDWRALCAEQARRDGVPDDTVHLLDAFDRSDTSIGVDSFPALLARCRAEVAPLAERVTMVLAGEVDADQAALFSRRFLAVAGLVESLGAPVGPLFLIALVRRINEVLADREPRALRVRAVADYFYSRVAVEQHRGDGAREFTELIDGLQWRDIGPGVRHALLEGPGPMGPLHVNLLEVVDRELHAIDNRPSGGDLVATVNAHGAIAGVSGGFFLYSEANITPPCQRTDPVGLLVSAGQVHNPPVFRRGALVQHSDGRVHIDRIGMDTCVIEGRPVDRVNQLGAGVGVWNRAAGDHAPEPGLIVVGRRIVGHGDHIPTGGFVLTGLERPVGTELTVELTRPAHTAMAGGPVLLDPSGPVRELSHEDFMGSAPPVTFSSDETFDQNLLPRMAAGVRSDNSLVFAAVDGRNLARAPGLTLEGTAELLEALDCATAVNLDGGSSKRMVVEGRIVDLPTTEVVPSGRDARVRPVVSALLVR